MSINDGKKRSDENCDLCKLGSEMVTLEQFIDFMKNDENVQKGLAEEAAAKESLLKINERFESNHMLIKVIDKLMECMFMDDCEDQMKAALNYLYVASDYYENRGNGHKLSNINNMLADDLYEIATHATSKVYELYY